MKSLATFARLVFLAALAAAPVAGALAQAYPSKPIRVIVPFPPGGSTDFLARIVGQKLTAAWGQQVVIDNRPGAGGTVGAAEAARATPDGYTLLMGAVHHTIATSAYAKLPYDFQKDFAPVTTVAIVPNILVVNPAVPANTVKELIAHAKANPGKLTYGSAGMGTAHHLIGESFNAQAGVDILHVPYKGSSPAVADLIGGQVTLMYDTVSSCLPHIKSGKLHPIAVTGKTRSKMLPYVPTVAEQGIPEYDYSNWMGVVAPAGTPEAVINKLNEAVVTTVKMPDVAGPLENQGIVMIGSSPAEFGKLIASEVGRWRKVVKDNNIKVEH